MNAFFTKKQRKLMRERRLKRKRYASNSSDSVSNPKRTRNENADDSEKPLTTATERDNIHPSPAISSKRILALAALSASASASTSASAPAPATAPAPAEAPAEAAAAAAAEIVVVPSGLSSKDAKKFRKEARRQARAEGRTQQLLCINEEEYHHKQSVQRRERKRSLDDDGSTPGSTRKREKILPTKILPTCRKKDIPRINELVQLAKRQSELEIKKKASLEEEQNLSDNFKNRYVALDCEMVGIGVDGKTSALARVSVVDWTGDTLLDTYVKVPDHVVDFRTQYSGIKPKHVKSSTAMNPDEVRWKVADLLKGKILVGHALHNDLDVLLLQHPNRDVRDTAKYRPFQRLAASGKWRPRKLRDLVKEHLGKVIQDGSHDSTIDAASTMELFRMVRADWEKAIEIKRAFRNKKGNN